MGGEGGGLLGQEIKKEERGRGGVGESTFLSWIPLQVCHDPKEFGWTTSGKNWGDDNLFLNNQLMAMFSKHCFVSRSLTGRDCPMSSTVGCGVGRIFNPIMNSNLWRFVSFPSPPNRRKFVLIRITTRGSKVRLSFLPSWFHDIRSLLLHLMGC